MVRAVRTFRGRNVYVLCLLGIFALSVLVALSFLEFRSENRERIQAVNNAYLEQGKLKVELLKRLPASPISVSPSG